MRYFEKAAKTVLTSGEIKKRISPLKKPVVSIKAVRGIGIGAGAVAGAVLGKAMTTNENNASGSTFGTAVGATVGASAGAGLTHAKTTSKPLFRAAEQLAKFIKKKI